MQDGGLLRFLTHANSCEFFDQRTNSSRYDWEIHALEPGRFLHVHVPPDFDHERTHSRIDVPVRRGHDAAAERAIEGCSESMLAANLLQIDGLLEWRVKWVKPDANFGASNVLVKFVREWRRREAVYVDDQALAKLTESGRDGFLQRCMVWFVIGRDQFVRSAWLRTRKGSPVDSFV